jgi:hypothetical protein
VRNACEKADKADLIEREKGRTLEGGQIVDEAKFYGEVGGSK